MGARIYRVLARLMPAGFRREYGDEMCRVAEQQWAERRPGLSTIGSGIFWTKQSWALVRASIGLRRREHQRTGGMTVEGFRHDLAQAARSLLRRPGFTLLTVVTLGLGVGATTAIFSAVRTVILRPLPYAEPDRVVVIFNTDITTVERRPGVSAANTRDFREAATLFDDVAVADPWSLDLTVDGRARSLRAWAVSEGFFAALGAQAELGRTFVDADYAEGGTGDIVVISYGSWVRRFGADPSIIGRTLPFQGMPRTVVGVLPAAFRFPDAAEAWIPRAFEPWDETYRSADHVTAVARLSEGVSLEQARAEADRIAGTLREAYPRVNQDLGFDLVPLREHLFGDVRTAFFVLTAAVSFVLLIACANVAGLMLVRGAQRERDFALRGALGAGTVRLVGQVSAESLLVAFTGCGIGLALAYGGVWAIRTLGPDDLPRIGELAVDGSTLAFALAASALSAILSGFIPSLRLSRPDLRGALGDGSRGSTGGRGLARARGRLVIAQIASAVVLLFGAGLLIRSFVVLLDQDLGFDPRDRLAVQVFAYDYATAGEVQSFLGDAVEKMQALPGVTDVALTTSVPSANDGVISNIDVNTHFTVVDRELPPAAQEPQTWVVTVSAGYFDVMGIDVVAGRDFVPSDNPDATPVLIVNEALARRYLGGEEPVGQRLLVRYGGAKNSLVEREIVGVVHDVRPLGHASDPRAEVYVPLAQLPANTITFVLKAATDADALLRPAMEAVWQADPAQSIWGSVTLDALVAEWLVERRFNLFLLTTFSAIALLLSAIGLYGLVSSSVERRMGELGIRRALGGRARDILATVLGEGARLTGIGLLLGLAASWYLSRFVRGMLYEVSPGDPWTLAGLALVVALIAAAATLIPALRAMRVDPVEALRSE